MIRQDFDAMQPTYECWSCHGVGTSEIRPHPTDHTHPGKIVCTRCGMFHRWLSKAENEDKRATVKPEVRNAVWRKYGNCCAHCGIPAEDLAFIGVMRTVQHVPPYAVAGDDGLLLPYCEWCQQRSASEMKRIKSLVVRLRELSGAKEDASHVA